MEYKFLSRLARPAFALALCLFSLASCSDEEPFTDDNIVVPPPADSIPEGDGLIADENLRAALLTLLKTDELTPENLATVHNLSLRAKNYSTLEGISALVISIRLPSTTTPERRLSNFRRRLSR